MIDNLGQECNDSNLPTNWNEINEALQKLDLIRGKVSKLIELSRHEGEALIEKIIEIVSSKKYLNFKFFSCFLINIDF